MTEIDTRQLIEDLAQHPDGAVTVESLARHLAASAFAAEGRLHDHPTWKESPLAGVTEATADFLARTDQWGLAWMAAFAFRRLREVDPEAASVAAREMQSMLEDGEAAADLAGQWLDEDGIDAERIVQAVQAERSEVAA